tara:strand:- start:373 stop:648 length:276 start_codon:yes stop_codon:yes gene_type:complete
MVFKMKGFSGFGNSPLRDEFVKVDQKGNKKGIGPFERKQSLRSRGRKLYEKGLAIGGAAGDAIFDQGDKLVEKSYKGTVGGLVTKKGGLKF